MSTHYEKTINIIQVDRDDQIIGPVERWRAHTDNILHRAISVVIFFEDQVFVQHRKHPLFDGWFDVTIASHQLWQEENKKPEDDISAVMANLAREWHVTADDLRSTPQYMGKIYYHAEDTDGNRAGYLDAETFQKLAGHGKHFHEQEFDYFYRVDLKKMIVPDFRYCYGYSLIPLDEILSGRSGVARHLTPWVQQAIREKVLI